MRVAIVGGSPEDAQRIERALRDGGVAVTGVAHVSGASEAGPCDLAVVVAEGGPGAVAEAAAVLAAPVVDVARDLEPESTLELLRAGADEAAPLDDPAAVAAAARRALARAHGLRSAASHAARFLDLYRHGPLGIFTYSPELVLTDCNEAFALVLRSSRERLVGLDLRRLEDRRVLPALEAAARGEHGRYRGPYRATTSGALVHVVLHTLPVLAADGSVRECLGVVLDVSRELAAERELAESEERYRRLVELLPDGVIVHDGRRILLANRAAVRLAGLDDPDALLGRDPLGLLDPESRAAAEERVARVLRGEPAPPLEERLVRPDGTSAWVLVSAVPITWEGRPASLTLARDVSERRRREELLGRRLHQLEAVARVAAAVTSQLDVRAVLETAVREIHGRLGYHNVTLLLHDPDAGELGRQAMAGAYEALAEPGYRQQVGVGLIGLAAATGETQLARDTDTDPRYVPGFTAEISTRSEVAVPVKLRDRVLAVLDVQETEPDAFDEADLMTLETVAGQLAACLENARLFEELERELEERRRVERSLRESEDRYRDLVEHAHEIIGHHALDGTILDINRAVFELYGLPPEAVAGTNIRDLLAPEFRAEFDGYLARLRERGEDAGLMRVRLPDGTRRLWAYRASLRTEGVAEPVVRGLVRDVTEEWRARRRLEESERLYRELVERSGIGILMDDVEGRIVYCNERAAELFGRPREQVEGTPTWELIHEEDRERARDHHRRRIAGDPEVPEWYEVRITRPDGAVRHVEVHAAARRQGGEAAGTRVYLRDVTERRELQRQLLQAQKLESVGRLAGGIAHEFNNLLQVVVARLDQALLEAPEDTGLARRLGAARDAALRGADLARQLLLFSRKQLPAVERIELNALLRELHGMLSRIVGEEVRLELDLAPGELWLDADPGQLQQAVVNLVVNARDATPRGGRITIATGTAEADGGADSGRTPLSPGRYATLAVEDTGHGIPEEHLAKIFEPFFTTKGPGRGTGLGLATVLGIVQQHRGGIGVTTKEGRGSRFALYLPLAEGEGTPSRPHPRIEEERPRRGEGELILAVEDDPGVREALAEILGLQGYRVEAVADGRSAVERLEAGCEDLGVLLVDVVLPDMSGVEVVARARELCPDVPVIFSTGYSEEQMRQQLPLDERTLLLGKPYDIAKLTAAIRRLLDARR